MQSFVSLLQSEYLQRSQRNPRYSLRAFAQQLKISHATLSGFLSGKRKITPRTIQKLASHLDLDASTIEAFLVNPSKPKKKAKVSQYAILKQTTYDSISEWYFDAIVELAKIPRIHLKPSSVAAALGISALQAKAALSLLQKLDLLTEDKNGRLTPAYTSSTNMPHEQFSSPSNRAGQRAVLEKSIQALDSVERELRDHSSVTMAISKKDLPHAKAAIKKFRRELDAVMQNTEHPLDEVYQLQISFFPLTNTERIKS